MQRASAQQTQNASRQQAETSQRAAEMAKRMEEAVRNGQLDPKQLEAARPQLDRARNAMREAGKRLQQGSPRAAGRAQSEAADRLDDAKRAMQQARPLGEQQKSELADVAKKQDELARDILELARRIDKKKNPEAQRNLEEAQKAAQRAEQDMQDGDVDEARREQQEAQRKLEQARKELQKERDRYTRLRQEELLFKIADEVTQMIQKQEGITQETRTIAAQLSDRSSRTLPRRLRKKVQRLGRDEGTLATTAEFLAKNLAAEHTLVFTWVLEQVGTDLQTLRSLMGARRPRVDSSIIGLQVEVVENLQQLLASLKEEINRKKQERENQQQQQQQKQQQNTNEGDRKRRLVPDIAELRLLKRLEQDMRGRLNGFLKMHETLGTGLEKFQAERLNRLTLRHAKISDLFNEFVRTRGLGGQAPGQQGDSGKDDEKKDGGTGKKKKEDK